MNHNLIQNSSLIFLEFIIANEEFKLNFLSDNFSEFFKLDKNEVLKNSEIFFNCFSSIEQKSLKLKLKVENKELDWEGKFKNKDLSLAIRILGTTSKNSFQGVIINNTKYAQLEESLTKKTLFYSNLSHEIRIQLQNIIGVSEYLKFDETEFSEESKMIKSLQYSTSNLLELLNNLLDFTKIDLNKVELNFSEVNIKELIDNLIANYSISIKQKDLSLISKVNPDLDRPLLVDKSKLNQVLNNLLSNSIKFTKSGFISVEAKILQETDNDIKIYIAVSDSGIGIPEDKLNILFQMFKKIEDNENQFGAGLGLYIVKGILDKMNSNIQVKSKQGLGTVFHFELILKKPKSQITQKDSINTQATKNLSGIKILLVEDNLQNQIIAKKYLQKWGAEISLADNGLIAFNKIKENDFDLILMDLQMPEMDGLEVTREVRKLQSDKYQKLPIIALTATALSNTREKVLEAGMNDYISKPFNMEELFNKVSKFFNKV
jgi:signal transduction histidine kinase/CheY-like chemotaxis protein